jgi:hypothetical protein
LELDYVRLAPGFAREVLEIYENWEGRDTVPMKVRELMMVIEIEVNKLYDPGGWHRIAAMPKPPKLKDTKLGLSTGSCLRTRSFETERFV